MSSDVCSSFFFPQHVIYLLDKEKAPQTLPSVRFGFILASNVPNQSHEGATQHFMLSVIIWSPAFLSMQNDFLPSNLFPQNHLMG